MATVDRTLRIGEGRSFVRTTTTPPPPPPVGTGSILAGVGVYNSNFPATGAAAFLAEYGVPSIYQVSMTDVTAGASQYSSSTWNIFDSTTAGHTAGDPWTPSTISGHTPVVSVGLGTYGRAATTTTPAIPPVTLSQVAGGALDSVWDTLISRANLAAPTTKIIWRVGWEFDGSWMPWSAQTSTNAALFITAYRRFADKVRASRGFLDEFDWCGDCWGLMQVYGPPAYPGDSYVDYIGVDVYNKSGVISGAAPSRTMLDQQWDQMLAPTIKWQLEFADTHGKKVSYPEHGNLKVNGTNRGSGDDGDFLGHLYTAATTGVIAGHGYGFTTITRPVAFGYASYFDWSPTEGGFVNDYRLDSLPLTKAAFQSWLV